MKIIQKISTLLILLFSSELCFSQIIPEPPYPKFPLGHWIETETILSEKLLKYPIHPMRKQWLWTLSIQYIQQKNYRTALPHLSELSTLLTGNWKDQVDFWRSYILIQYDQYEAALNLLEHVVDGNQNLSEVKYAFIYRGYIFTRFEQWKQALDQFEAYSVLYPESDELFTVNVFKAECWFRLGRYEEAIKELEISYLVVDDEQLKLRIKILLNEAYYSSGNYPESIRLSNHIEEKYKQSFYKDFIAYRKGMALMKDNLYDASIQSFKQVNSTSEYYAFAQVATIQNHKLTGRIPLIESYVSPKKLESNEAQQFIFTHKIWSAYALNRWGKIFSDLNDLHYANQQEIAVDSLWLFLGAAIQQGKFKTDFTAIQAFQKAIEYRKRVRQITNWPEADYGIISELYSQQKYHDVSSYGLQFLSTYPEHPLSEKVFLQSVLSLNQLSLYDSLENVFQTYRNRYLNISDGIDILWAENYFNLGKGQLGLDLLERKIRYAPNDSIKQWAYFSAGVSTLFSGRSDLSIGYFRILSRFYPDYKKDDVYLYVFLSEYYNRNYPFIVTELKNSRDNKTWKYDDIILPIEVELYQLRNELTSEVILSKLLSIKSPEMFFHILLRCNEFGKNDELAKIINHPQLNYQLQSWKSDGDFIRSYLDGIIGNSQVFAIFSKRYIAFDQLTDLWVNQTNDWMKKIIFRYLFIQPEMSAWIMAMSEAEQILPAQIDDMKLYLTEQQYANLTPDQLEILMTYGTTPTGGKIRFNYLLGLSAYYVKNQQPGFAALYRKQAIAYPTLSTKVEQLLFDDLIYIAENESLQVFESEFLKVKSGLSDYLRKQLEVKRLELLIGKISFDEFERNSQQVLSDFPDDQSVEEKVVLMKVKWLMLLNKKVMARNYVKAFQKKYPLSEILREVNRLVR